MLTACSLFPQKYDESEYTLLVLFTASLEKLHDSCVGDGAGSQILLADLYENARVFELYTRYTPDDKEVRDTAIILKKDVEEMKDHYLHYAHNKEYCELKSDLMHEKAITILKAVGDKPRR